MPGADVWALLAGLPRVCSLLCCVDPMLAVRWVPGSGSTFPAPRQAQSGERRRRFPSRELRHEPPCRICRARAVTPWDPGYMGGKASLAPYQLVSLTPRGVGKPCV
jgi:hypothetical protein